LSNTPDKQTILIVDDNAMNLQLLGGLLVDEGYKVSVAKNGVEALKRLTKVTPAVILLDICMPEMDGIECCKQIRMQDTLKHVPVVFLTANDDLNENDKAMASGGSVILNKPIDFSEVLTTILQLT